MMKTKHLTVMFTDIKGFTSKTSFSSREKLHLFLELHDELLAPIFKRHHGKVVKTIGDAFLVVFTSPTNAVLCGVAIQKKLDEHNKELPKDERLKVRVAVNSGEVTIRGKDVFGEAVNIAARLEGITKAGEIYFTESVYLSMNKNEIAAREIGYKSFKGIPEKIKVFKVIRGTKKRFIFFGKEKPIKRKLYKKSKLRKFLKYFIPLFILFLLIVTISNSNNQQRVMQSVEDVKQDLEDAFVNLDEQRIQDDLNMLRQYSSQVDDNAYIINLTSYYETKYEELEQRKVSVYDQVNIVSQNIDDALNQGNIEAAQKNLNLLDELSKQMNYPSDIEEKRNSYWERFNSYTNEVNDLWNQANSVKKDIEISFAYRNPSGVSENLGVLKHISGQLGNPGKLEKDISNYEDRYNNLVQEIADEQAAQALAAVVP